MAGLIDVGILRPELAGAFGAGYRSSQQARQQATEAEQQLAMNRQKLQMDEMTMERLREDRAAMLQLQDRLKAAGQDPDLNKVFDALIATGNPDYVTKGIDGKRRLKEQDQFALIMGGGVATPPVAAPNAMAKEVGAAPEQPANQLGSGMFGMTVGPSAPAVSVNQLRPELVPAGVDRNALINRRNSLIALGTPQAIAAANVIDRDIREKTPVESKPSEIKQYELAVSQGYKGSFLDFKKDIAAASRPLPQPREPREPAIRTTKVELADGSIGVMNLDTGAITPATVGGQLAKGKPSAFAEKTAAQRKQLSLDLDRTITELTNAYKDGGLIDQSTGSGFGRLMDVGAGFVGAATSGAIAAGKLAPIADMVLKMVPRFEGPQSDKDTKSYKEAAGQLADSTLPNKIRKEAAKTVVRLMQERKGQFGSPEMVSTGAAQDTGVDTSNPLLK
jgi:hypothetical protein